MADKRVRCQKCGEWARLIAVEGQLFPDRSNPRPATVEVIDCPKCGWREQPELATAAKAK